MYQILMECGGVEQLGRTSFMCSATAFMVNSSLLHTLDWALHVLLVRDFFLRNRLDLFVGVCLELQRK